MEAEFRNARGLASTDRFGDFSSPLREIVKMELDNNFRRTIFISAFNAVQRNLKQTEKTIHCRDEGPADTEDAINSAKLLIVTSSTLVNDTLGDFLLEKKPTIFCRNNCSSRSRPYGVDPFLLRK